jgi:hypothetical protein
MKKLSAVFAVLVVFLLSVPLVGETAQFFAQHYTFSADGHLQPALSVSFIDGESRPVTAVLGAKEGGERAMTLAYQEQGKIALQMFQKGSQYVLYKLKFRSGHEDLLVLSYGERGAGKTKLNDVSIIGADALGQVRLLPVATFQSVAVFNSPLQIRQNEAILFLDRAPKVMSIKWDEDVGQYVVSGIL